MQKIRPAVIIQNNPNNKSSGNTIVVPITHDLSNMSCMAHIESKYAPNGDIILDGQVNTSNLMCISKARLGDYICDLSNNDMKLVDEALSKSIDLMRYYADIKKKSEKQLQYITKVKSERNNYKDELIIIRSELSINENESIRDTIKKLKSEHIN